MARLGDAERLALRHGPHRPPRVRRGDSLSGLIRGNVIAGSYSDAPVPWPRVRKGGSACLVLRGDLARAVRVEAEQVVAHHFGVSKETVWKWRKALRVPAFNEGGRHLQRLWFSLNVPPELAEAERAKSKGAEALAKQSARR